ncbi:hypothetical protein M0805_002066, partial [Coniferiporia weirii]
MSVSDSAILAQILAQLNDLQKSQQVLAAKVDSILTPSSPRSSVYGIPIPGRETPSVQPSVDPHAASPSTSVIALSSSLPSALGSPPPNETVLPTEKERERALYPSRVILTTYPDQHGIKPYPLVWGAEDPKVRGPVICSRLASTLKQRNAIGAHSGSYSIYRALAVALGTLSPTHKPAYALTEPPVPIPPVPAWYDPSKIVSFDPWGHLVPQVFRDEMEGKGLDVRPSIAVTKAHIKLSELDEASRRGEIPIDGKIAVK